MSGAGDGDCGLISMAFTSLGSAGHAEAAESTPEAHPSSQNWGHGHVESSHHRETLLVLEEELGPHHLGSLHGVPSVWSWLFLLVMHELLDQQQDSSVDPQIPTHHHTASAR